MSHVTIPTWPENRLPGRRAKKPLCKCAGDGIYEGHPTQTPPCTFSIVIYATSDAISIFIILSLKQGNRVQDGGVRAGAGAPRGGREHVSVTVKFLIGTGHQRRIVLHHNDASSHPVKQIIPFLKEKNVELMSNPAYSPDLAP
ncbi:hypothetical protein EVAR_22577_1 [Eumeta japonica]|uniref:Tc1-like transposase DDE domain-containing protein n=1 Tax=Eumeta variegata TaxID=151549 RepID=A0A4C1U7J2_EUMVA|nr:hypothetical protein EVAR_22577_1 [Eumeta japonica]